jgi:hypothetical protein
MNGHCANEVEVEQIVADESQGSSLGGHNHTSFVQLRASIPLFWSQVADGLTLKPDVCLANIDPLYHATALHFSQLLQRYGSPVYVLNLVKRREKVKRESLLSEEFDAAVQMLNAGVSAKEHAIRYIHFDFTQESKMDKKAEGGTDTHIERLFKLTSQIVDHVGIFHAGTNRWARCKSAEVPVAQCMQQRGILRSNCIDCLDRTNAAQYRAGERALMLQFQALGLTDDDVPSGCVETNEETSQLGVLYCLYLNLGNQLASQYVGSEAHDKTGAGQSASSAGMRAVNKAVVSARRYISNSFKDQEKQQAIDVFLGIYNPRLMTVPIWLCEDRSFLWSSQKFYEHCPCRPNRPPDAWWQQPLQSFLNGVQVAS